jgi:hypothetical protein
MASDRLVVSANNDSMQPQNLRVPPLASLLDEYYLLSLPWQAMNSAKLSSSATLQDESLRAAKKTKLRKSEISDH